MEINYTMKHLLFAWGLLLSFQSFSQEQLGLRLENYAGTSSLSLNPTGALNSPLNWDINLAGAGVFFENNYGYIRQTNMVHLLRNRSVAEFEIAPEVEGQTGTHLFIADFYRNGKNRYANLETYLDGPAFSVKIGDAHTVGLFTRVRAHGGTQDLTDEFSYYEYDALRFQTPVDIPAFEGAFMTWAEIGLNYAIEIPTTSGSISFGTNLKRLWGYEGGYVENIAQWEHTKVEEGVVSLGAPNGRFAFTNSNLTEDDFSINRNGKGFGIDLGATLKISEYEDTYAWRISFAILDIGAIRFTENAQKHRVNTESTVTLVDSDYDQYESVEQVDEIVQLFSEQALGSRNASLQDNQFTMTLPTALSIQVDRGFTENIFLNAALIQRMSFVGIGPKRGNLLALTPRFEHRWFSASLPVALYNWSAPRVGFAARFGYFVVGSDDLGSFVGRGNLSGTDIYFALKVNPFEIGGNLFSGGGFGKKAKYGKRGKVKCYDF